MKLVEVNWNPTDRQLRQFGIISALVLPTIAWRCGGGPSLVIGLAVAGGLLALIGWIRPQTLKLLFVGLTIVAIPFGMVFGELVMLAIYFFVFLPIGLVFQFTGRDSLRLKPDRKATTYWQPRRQATDVASYYHQS